MDSTLFSADTLPPELAERLLAVAIHTLARRPGRRGPDAWSNGGATDRPSSNPLHTLLCVLGPRRTCPDVTCAALARCWWVDLDFASGIGDVELLRIMDRLAQARGGRGSLPRRPLQWTHVAMDQASKQGFVHVLDWWIERFGAACWYTEEALTGAAEAGHLDTLKWWTDRKDALACELNNKILLHATLGGHKEICEWWLNTHFDKSKPDVDSLRCFAATGVLIHALMHAVRTNDSDFDMFDWWFEHPSLPHLQPQRFIHWHTYALKFRDFIWEHRSTSPLVLDGLLLKIHQAGLLIDLQYAAGMCAAVSSNPDTIALLGKHMPPPQLHPMIGNMYVNASAAGNVHVLEWLCGLGTWEWEADSELEQRTGTCLIRASGAGHVDVLNWWVRSCPWFQTARSAFVASPETGSLAAQEASAGGHVHVLEWWQSESQLSFEFRSKTMSEAAAGGHIVVMEWWLHWVVTYKKQWPRRVDWSAAAIVAASEQNQINVLDWWLHQQLREYGKLPYNMRNAVAAITAATFKGNIAVLEWLQSNNPLFVDCSKYRFCLFPAKFPPRSQVFDWWIDTLNTIKADLDEYSFMNLQLQLFLAMAHSSSIVLLKIPLGVHNFIRPWSEILDDIFYNALNTGSICILQWWSQCGFPFPEAGNVEPLVKKAGRHVQAWFAMREKK